MGLQVLLVGRLRPELDVRHQAQLARRKAARIAPLVTPVVSMVLVPPTLLIIGVGLYLGSGVELGQVLGG